MSAIHLGAFAPRGGASALVNGRAVCLERPILRVRDGDAEKFIARFGNELLQSDFSFALVMRSDASHVATYLTHLPDATPEESALVERNKRMFLELEVAEFALWQGLRNDIGPFLRFVGDAVTGRQDALHSAVVYLRYRDAPPGPEWHRDHGGGLTRVITIPLLGNNHTRIRARSGADEYLSCGTARTAAATYMAAGKVTHSAPWSAVEGARLVAIVVTSWEQAIDTEKEARAMQLWDDSR